MSKRKQTSSASVPEAEIRLEPYDIFRVTYLEHEPLERPEPEPFAIDQGIAALKRIQWPQRYLEAFRQATLPLPRLQTRAAALFYFEAMLINVKITVGLVLIQQKLGDQQEFDRLPKPDPLSREAILESMKLGIKAVIEEHAKAAVSDFWSELLDVIFAECSSNYKENLLNVIRSRKQPGWAIFEILTALLRTEFQETLTNMLKERLHTKLSQPLPLEQIKDDLAIIEAPWHPLYVVPMLVYFLLPFEEYTRFLAEEDSYFKMNHISLCQWFDKEVLPYLSHEEKGLFREAFQKPLQKAIAAQQTWSLGMYIATGMGMHKELLNLVSSFTKAELWQRIGQIYAGGMQNAILGLGDRATVIAEMKRLNLPLVTPEQIRVWLAHTGFDELDLVVESILKIPDKKKQDIFIQELTRAEGPQTAAAMLRLYLESKVQSKAHAWLKEHQEFAIAGLKPVAGGSGKLAQEAEKFLRRFGAAAAAPGLETFAEIASKAKKRSQRFALTVSEIILPEGLERYIEVDFENVSWRWNMPSTLQTFVRDQKYDRIPDELVRLLNSQGGRAEIQGLGEALYQVKTPEMAQKLLPLFLKATTRTVVRNWMNAAPEYAITGLIPVALSGSKDADLALGLLRRFKNPGHQTLMQELVAQYGADATNFFKITVFKDYPEELRALKDNQPPGWLIEATLSALKLKKGGKAPEWLYLNELPPLRLGRYALNAQQRDALVRALRTSSLDVPHLLISIVQECAAPTERETFVWQLFEQWQHEGYPGKDTWALKAVGLLGGDFCATKLPPLIRIWPGESQHQRAVLGLNCLRVIGTDTALMQIKHIEKVKFKGIKQKAREAMDEIARVRNLSRDELEDRIVPTCDLNENGTRRFDYGPRQFQVVLSSEMKPKIRDEKGKLRASLPKANKNDDAEKAQAAALEWKLLKKQLQDVVKLQAKRLTHAMANGRRWSKEDFEILFVRHPLLLNMGRLLIWGGYNEKGELSFTFRITEEQSYADMQEDEIDLSPAASIGIVHTARLSEEERAAWGEILSDYELMPPFKQLTRRVYALEKEEQDQTYITRFKDIAIPAAVLIRMMENLGWQRGRLTVAKQNFEQYKEFPFAGVFAALSLSQETFYWDSVPGNIEKCCFLPGTYKTFRQQKTPATPIELGEIDPVALSEALRDLYILAWKGE